MWNDSQGKSGYFWVSFREKSGNSQGIEHEPYINKVQSFIILYFICLVIQSNAFEFYLFLSIVDYGCMTCIENSGPLPEVFVKKFENVSLFVESEHIWWGYAN